MLAIGANMQRLTIIRGLPGSGKSTLARALADSLSSKHVETDMFFVGTDGEYRFNSADLSAAHSWCQARVEGFLLLGYSVVVSNTFTALWEMEPYLQMAKALGVVVQVVEVSLPFSAPEAHPTEHGVPVEVQRRMAARWERLEHFAPPYA